MFDVLFIFIIVSLFSMVIAWLTTVIRVNSAEKSLWKKISWDVADNQMKFGGKKRIGYVRAFSPKNKCKNYL